MLFEEFFYNATGFQPYAYQKALAETFMEIDVLKAPTGVGKTAAVVLPWLWRRAAGASVPRRLVYCLPRRSLVEQTAGEVRKWLARIHPAEGISVWVLMGGEEQSRVREELGWDLRPADFEILIGTQDMLLSRALNRGYAMSPYRWPLPYAMLNNDCLWVMDEVQLMGAGLETSLQLQHYRDKLGAFGNSHTIWMSATLPDRGMPGKRVLTVGDDADVDASLDRPLRERLHAAKTIRETAGDVKTLARLAVSSAQHGLTLVMVNQVKRAREVYREIERLHHEVLLLHSRFRPHERHTLLDKLQRFDGVVVSTQVLEAGVDISGATLITDAAAWSSLLQRFGRCNRTGRVEGAEIWWADVRENPDPYREIDVAAATAELRSLEGETLTTSQLMSRQVAEQSEDPPLLRQKDVIDLYDTSPDLSGNYLDISRYVRDQGVDTDALVAWWVLEDGHPREDAFPGPAELCPVPLAELRKFQKRTGCDWWVFDVLAERWQRQRDLRPGQVVVVDATKGGYSPTLGWDPGVSDPVPPVDAARRSESVGSDHGAEGKWLSLKAHSAMVAEAAEELVDRLGATVPPTLKEPLVSTARLHDWGKATAPFQARIHDPTPDELYWAKAPSSHFNVDPRKGPFRHELAGALALLQLGTDHLVTYLVAAHHGRVRLRIRSTPTDQTEGSARSILGVGQDLLVPEVDLGAGWCMPGVQVDLAPAALGESAWGASWTARALDLLDTWGPFRLAYLEALVRSADALGSQRGEGDG